MVKEKIVKYMIIVFVLGFLTFISIKSLKNCSKQTTEHFHNTKPEDERYIKLPPHVKRENIIFEVTGK